MIDGRRVLPSAREQGLQLAYELARKELAGTGNVEEQCRKGGVRYMAPDRMIVDYLNGTYLVTIPDVEILLEGSKEEVPLRDKILILHYLTSAKGTPTAGVLVTYRQLPGGASYFPAFDQRAIQPLLRHFGKEPEVLVDAAAKLGGHKANYGDVSVTINGFPRVPVTLVLWRGDDELAPGGSILFDASISDYLSTEDISVLCEVITWRLIKSSPRL